MSEKKTRLDQRLIELGLAETKARAQALIMAGAVEVDGALRDKPGVRVGERAVIELKERLKYVSRGGRKLEGALADFGVSPSGLVCLDVGASTGGFTDCLLQQGAKKVYCLDVGKGILAWKLRNDPRVTVMEGKNARFLKPGDLPEPIALAVIDVSFISLTLVLPAVFSAGPEKIIALVKPQFEAGKDQVGKGGVVKDPELIKKCVDKVANFSRERGWDEVSRSPSTLLGPRGNREHFLYLSTG